MRTGGFPGGILPATAKRSTVYQDAPDGCADPAPGSGGRRWPITRNNTTACCILAGVTAGGRARPAAIMLRADLSRLQI